MAYLIELSPEEEQVVHRRASRLGITPQEYVRRSLHRQLRRGNSASPLTLTEAQRQTLEQLNTRLPPSFWERYAELSRKIRARTVSEAEHAEIKGLAAQEEAWNGERLQMLQQMAQKRNVSLLRFMKHNDIGHRPQAERTGQGCEKLLDNQMAALAYSRSHGPTGGSSSSVKAT